MQSMRFRILRHAATLRDRAPDSRGWRTAPRWSVIALLMSVLGVLTVPGMADEGILHFVQSHCLDCHSGEDSEAGFDLSALAFDVSSSDRFQVWSMVHTRVAKGEMPPADADQPDHAAKARLLATLGGALADADRKRQQQLGRSELRRLSRVEYANSLKDILDLPHLELEDMLPPDGIAHGYSKSAGALDFSHVMVTRYLEVADHALWQALAQRAGERFASKVDSRRT